MKTLFIIDAYNLIYRMFYAIPEMHTRDGKVVNAIFWVAKFLRSLADENPDASIVIATDVGQSFRAKEYVEYKAQRDRMPDNLRSQIDGVFALFDAAGIQILSKEGFEADDIIGSLVMERSNGWTEYQFIIISSDKDLCQFVQDGHIHIYDAMKRKFMKEKDVLEKFSVPVQQVRDYLAIVWDSSDNIPGIAWFGPKKAEDLLGKYGSLDAVYDHIDELSPKVQQTLIDQKGNAFLSQKLATIITDLEVPLHLTDADILKHHISKSQYIDILRMYEFRSLLPRDEISMIKTLEKKKNREILSLKGLDELLEHIQMIGKCILATDKDTIVIGCGDDIFTIHTNLVESSGFISWLLQSEIQIYGYDLKEEYKRLLTKEKPLQKVSEGQGILF